MSTVSLLPLAVWFASCLVVYHIARTSNSHCYVRNFGFCMLLGLIDVCGCDGLVENLVLSRWEPISPFVKSLKSSRRHVHWPQFLIGAEFKQGSCNELRYLYRLGPSIIKQYLHSCTARQWSSCGSNVIIDVPHEIGNNGITEVRAACGSHQLVHS